MRTIALFVLGLHTLSTGCASRARYALREGEYTKLSGNRAVVSYRSSGDTEPLVNSITFDTIERSSPEGTSDNGRATDVALWVRDQEVMTCTSTLVGVGVPVAALAGLVVGGLAAAQRGADDFGIGMTGYLGLLGGLAAGAVVMPIASHVLCAVEREDVVVLHAGPPQ